MFAFTTLYINIFYDVFILYTIIMIINNDDDDDDDDYDDHVYIFVCIYRSTYLSSI